AGHQATPGGGLALAERPRDRIVLGEPLHHDAAGMAAQSMEPDQLVDAGADVGVQPLGEGAHGAFAWAGTLVAPAPEEVADVQDPGGETVVGHFLPVVRRACDPAG